MMAALTSAARPRLPTTLLRQKCTMEPGYIEHFGLYKYLHDKHI